MSHAWVLITDAAELAVETARLAQDLGLRVEPEVSRTPFADAVKRLVDHPRVAILSAKPPEAHKLVAVASAGLVRDTIVPVGMAGEVDRYRLGLALDLGLPAVEDPRPLVTLMALLEAGHGRVWAASTRGLAATYRERLGDALTGAERGAPRLADVGGGVLALEAEGEGQIRVGEARDVVAALRALRAAHRAARPPMPTVQGASREPVLEVIFGPPRALSDPASKAALEPYDLPFPVEELCSSASRAAAEAARIGFPVRIALASPDLRVWEHPDLMAESVDNAARVRDVFRQVMALAAARAPDARLLGVTVSAGSSAQALLWTRMTPLPDGLVLAHVGFADPHGAASEDAIETVLPATAAGLEAALSRLAGSGLLLEGTAVERQRTLASLGDVLHRLAAFVHDMRREVESVEVDPLALLVGGDVEAREVCVTVGDAFARSLEAPRAG